MQSGLDDLRWLRSPDATSRGVTADATVDLRFRVDVSNARDIPDDVLKAGNDAANQACKGKGYTPEVRAKVWARTKWNHIANWIKTQPEALFRTPSPGKGDAGFHYAFKGSAWKAGKPSLIGIGGPGSGAAIGALPNAGDEALSAAAKAKWAERAKFAGRVGGRLLVIVGIGNSAYEIYSAENKSKEVVKQVGGWTGACAGAKAGAWGGAKVGAGVALVIGNAGPQAAVPEEVGTVPLGAGIGGVIGGAGGAIGGWWFGSEVTETVYEWWFEIGVE